MIIKNNKLAMTVRSETFSLSELNRAHISRAIVVTNLNHHSLTSLELT